MAPTKILAIIFAVAVLVKLAFIIIRPHLWMKIAAALMANYARTMVVYLILAAVTGYYVLTSINIMDVAAVMMFTSLLIGVGLAPYSASLAKLGEEAMRVGLGRAWLPMVVWGLLALWILYAALA